MSDREIYAGLAERLNFPLTERLERLLRKVATPLEGRLLLDSPAPPEDLAAKLGITAAEVEAKLRELTARGLMIPTRKGYFFSRNMVQFHDAALSSPAQYVDRELCDLWEDFAVNEFYPAWAGFITAMPHSPGRVVPHYRAIKDLPDVQPYENIYEIVASATRWSVVPCSCRRQTHKCDKPLDTCLQLNRAAEYTISRGAGPELTKEEALAIIDKAEEAGLIHELDNRRADFGVVCNCCTDCCIMFRPLLEHRPDEVERGYAKSRYEATIDEDTCTGCELCLDRCLLGAIEMREVAGYNVKKAVVNPAKCWGCGACVTGCLEEAATLHAVRPPEHIPAEAVAH